MADSVPDPEMESQKRRSTRIVQAVPLTVTGVDALGRPFQEHTSTLIINCHGCRYQSKHYVLKNMWVTFEVPHQEAGREPRRVRARVTWIQRPRTVRELFQIGVELEVPGNVWGIAFPPGDWFPFPESAAQQEIPSPAATGEEESPAASWTEEMPAVGPAPEAEEDNVRVLPMPGEADASLQLARQVARLVVDAKQQVQGAAREAASRAVSEETRSLLAALEDQLKTATEKSVESAVAAHMGRLEQQTRERADKEGDAALASLREGLSRQMDGLIAEARAKIEEQVIEIERARSTELEQRLQGEVNGAVEKLKSLTGDLDANTHQVRDTIENLRRDSEEASAVELHRWHELLEQKSAEARERLALLEQASRHLYDEVEAATSSAETGWRGRLEADLAAASARWNEKLEASLENAAARMAERLAQRAEEPTRQIEEQILQRVKAAGSGFSQAAADADNILGSLRASIDKETSRGETVLAQLQQTAGLVETRRSELSALVESSAEELARRGEALLDAQSREMNRRAETTAGEMAARLQPTLESAGQESIARLANELEQRLSPQIAAAKDILDRLAMGQSEADRALAEHQSQIWQASERSVQDSVARAKEILAQVEKEFGESARNNTTRWLADLDTKATETTHTTFEALFKSSEWYEKKVQAQMQSTLEKGLDQASTSLRDKAREMSGLFAGELDHYSRSYVEHAREQMEKDSRDAAEKASLQMGQAGDAAVADLRERADQTIREKFEQSGARANAEFQQHAARIQEHTEQAQSKLETDAGRLAAEFQRNLSQHAQQTLDQGKQELSSQLDQARNSLRAEADSLDRRMETSAQSLTARAMDDYKQRLENASNSWLLTTVARLNQQSEELIGQLAASTEQKLRGVCTTVVGEVGETLRQRLTGLFTGATQESGPTPATPSSNPENKE